MRLLIHVLCVMLSVSFVLAPLGRVHAHVAGDHHVNVHGGHTHDAGGRHDHADEAHSHDGGPAHTHESSGTVIDLEPDRSQGSQQVWKPLYWIAAFFVVVLTVLELRQVGSFRRPPRARTRPPSPYPHALPLLRGPPLSN